MHRRAALACCVLLAGCAVPGTRPNMPTPAERARVEPGMTPEQVSRLLGTERSRVFYRHSGEEVWDWNIVPDTPGYGMRFNVHFKDGVVLRTSQSMVFPSRRFPGLDD